MTVRSHGLTVLLLGLALSIAACGGSASTGGDSGSGWTPTYPTGLDTTFSANGSLRVCGTAGGQGDGGYSALVDVSGRITVVGASWKEKNAGQDTAFWRFNANGAVDKTLAGKGYRLLSNSNGVDTPQGSAVLDSSGRIVAAHKAGFGMAAARYGANATFDTTFNGTGYNVRSPVLWGESMDNIALDSQGRIVIATTASNSGGTLHQVTLRRFTTNGALDTTFNGTGTLTLPPGAGLAGTWGGPTAIDSQDRIVVAGAVEPAPFKLPLTLWRFLPDGQLDTTFSGDGVVTWNQPTALFSATAVDVKMDAQDRIVVAGLAWDLDYNSYAVFWRFMPDGSLDTTLAGTGFTMPPVGTGSDVLPMALLLDASGRWVLVGHLNDGGRVLMAVWRYLDDGTLDTTFHGTGVVASGGAAGGWYDSGISAAFDSAGRIVVTGVAVNNNGNECMGLWRVLP